MLVHSLPWFTYYVFPWPCTLSNIYWVQVKIPRAPTHRVAQRPRLKDGVVRL